MIRFSRETTNVIKGFAIILMVIHHVFQFQFVEFNNYINLVEIITKSCVAIFAFITGMFYFKNNHIRNFKYSINKIVKLLLNYWLIYLIVICLTLLISDKYLFNLKNTILEMFGLYTPVMPFCWYIAFYIIVMLLLPLYVRIIGLEKSLLDIFKSILFWFVLIAINFMFSNFIPNDILDLPEIVRFYFPIVMFGILCSKYNVLDILCSILKSNNTYKNTTIAIFLIVIGLVLRIIKPFGFGMDFGFINAFFIIIGFNLLSDYNGVIKKIFIFIGKYSMDVWFLHCLFYNKYTKDFFIPYFNKLGGWFIAVIFILIACLILAYIIEKLKLLTIKQLKNN